MNSQQISWLLVIISVYTTVGAPSPNDGNYVVQTIPELSPINEALNNEANQVTAIETESSREKRLALITKTGIKSLLLNFIFGKIDGALDAKTRFINQLDKQNIIKNEQFFGITTQKPAYGAGFQKPALSGSYGVPTTRPPRVTTPRTTTPAPIEFSTSSPVSLVIPDQLYGNSFGLVTNISQTLGDVLFNTAGRAQEFANMLSSKTRRTFGFSTNLLGGGTNKRKS